MLVWVLCTGQACPLFFFHLCVCAWQRCDDLTHFMLPPAPLPRVCQHHFVRREMVWHFIYYIIIVTIVETHWPSEGKCFLLRGDVRFFFFLFFFSRVTHCDGTKIGQGNKAYFPILCCPFRVWTQRKQTALPLLTNMLGWDNLWARLFRVSAADARIRGWFMAVSHGLRMLEEAEKKRVATPKFVI